MITTLWNQGIKKLGWCSLKDGIKGGKASPPQSILQEFFFDNGNLKKMLFKNFDVKLRKLYQQKKRGFAYKYICTLITTKECLNTSIQQTLKIHI